MNFLKRYGIYILIILLTFFALQPLLQSGFFSMHDDEQVGRLYELDQAIKAGHYPVRITQNLGFGYGYALFNFYPPFVYYIAEVFVLVGFGYITSIKLMIALGFILSAVTMYLFAKEYLGKYGALVAAIAYVYAPYHAVDVYVRGALPEFWTFVFIPAIFWAYKKLADTKNQFYGLLAGLLFCCLILTHNLVAMMSGLAIGFYVMYLLSQTKNKTYFLLWVVISGLVGLGFSASFWLPSFTERNNTMIELLTKELADYNQHYVYIRQFWNSPWGYGGSLYGLEDGLSFQIGKLHILGAFLSFPLALLLLFKKDRKAKILIVFGTLFLIATFMITFYSDVVWDTLKLFSYIQFPWRFLLFSAFTASFLLGSVVLFTKNTKIQLVVSVLLILGVILLNKDYFQPYKYYAKATDKDYVSLDVIKWKTSYMAFEYVPKGVITEVVPGNITKIAITQADVAKASYEIVKGKMNVTEKTIKPQVKEWQIEGTGGVLRLNQYAYPGWKVFMDDQEIAYTADNNYKLIDIVVPSGKHTVKAVFTDTMPRMLGNTISAASILLVILYIMSFSRKQKKIKHEKDQSKKHK